MEKTDQENQAMSYLNDSSQVEASINELESNLTEPDISTNANNLIIQLLKQNFLKVHKNKKKRLEFEKKKN